MTDSALDVMIQAETLDTKDLEDVLLWVEFTLSKRVGRSTDSEQGGKMNG
jgi:hypothetical protein